MAFTSLFIGMTESPGRNTEENDAPNLANESPVKVGKDFSELHESSAKIIDNIMKKCFIVENSFLEIGKADLKLFVHKQDLQHYSGHHSSALLH